MTRAPGFSLVELLCVVTVVSLLATIAYPAYNAYVMRSRRADAVVALVQLQSAQERFRFTHRSYADLTDLAWPAVSPAQHYALSVPVRGESGFEALASALGGQRADERCRHLKIVVAGIDTTYASGPDDRAANPASDNRRCWSH